MRSNGTRARPRVVVSSVQGRKSLAVESAQAIEAIADVSYLARDDALSVWEAATAFAEADIVALTPKVSPRIDETLLARLPMLRGLCLHATGYDFVDLDALRRHGVALCTLPQYSTRSVAEQTIGLLLSVSARIHLGNDRSRGLVAHHTSLRGFELHGRTLGILGCGRIGGTVAQLAQAFGMTVIAYDIDPKPVDGVTYVERDDLFERSDVVSLHCPLAFRAPPLVGVDELARMRPGAVLINSSREALVDDRAVVDAIRDGRLRGYAVDDEVISGPEVDDLLREGRILQTGHSAWWTDEVLARGSRMWGDSIEAMIRGAPINLVTDAQVTGAVTTPALGARVR